LVGPILSFNRLSLWHVLFLFSCSFYSTDNPISIDDRFFGIKQCLWWGGASTQGRAANWNPPLRG